MTEVTKQMTNMDDSGFLSALIPNRGRAKLMRVVAGFCLLIGLLGAFTIIRSVALDLYAHSYWPVVKGDVLKYDEKSAVPPGSSSRHDVYWIEFEVEFDPREHSCTTGSSWGVPSQFPCIGTISTRSTSSWSSAQQWTTRHPRNSAAAFLYDPATGKLRFADESISDVVDPGKSIAVLVTTSLGLWLWFAANRRRRFLETLPEDYDATPSDPRRDAKPDELTDLKLS